MKIIILVISSVVIVANMACNNSGAAAVVPRNVTKINNEYFIDTVRLYDTANIKYYINWLKKKDIKLAYDTSLVAIPVKDFRRHIYFPHNNGLGMANPGEPYNHSCIIDPSSPPMTRLAYFGKSRSGDNMLLVTECGGMEDVANIELFNIDKNKNAVRNYWRHKVVHSVYTGRQLSNPDSLASYLQALAESH